MQLKLREYGVIFSAVIITGLCWWRMTDSGESARFTASSIADQRPAPPFELYDQQSHLVKLDAFLHRHTVVLVFFDASQNPEQLETLVWLREFYPALKSNGIVAIGISNALPQQIRKQSAHPFPFPILADISAGQPDSASKKWGVCNQQTADGRVTIRPAVFLIDRTGMTGWHNDAPQPVSDPQQLVNELVAGKQGPQVHDQ